MNNSFKYVSKGPIASKSKSCVIARRRSRRSNLLKGCFVASLLATTLFYSSIALSSQKSNDSIHGVSIGMSESDFFKIYHFKEVRGLRHEGIKEWFSYNDPIRDPFHRVITFYFQNEKLVQWKVDDRPELVNEYLSEFSFYQAPSIIYQAIKEVLLRMPYKDFLNVTNRQRPVLFTEFYSEGTARFASSSEFIVTKDDPPCCKEGFTIVKLGMSLELAKTPGPIEGVIAHEIAHRVLDSIRKGNVNCDAERAANALIKKWGFKKEFKEASKLFGQKKGDPAACQETPKKGVANEK